jgi:uncharacterized repeat protein (TIGR03803 family)
VLYTFSGPEGANPIGGLVQGDDYGFYGTTVNGGTHRVGTIFRIGSQGNFKVLYNFDIAHGAHPSAPLIQASDGNFYGVAPQEGTLGGGVAFRMTPSGVLTVLHNFSGTEDGGYEIGGLVDATDGNFYGTNSQGGANGQGILFRLTPNGQFTKLHDFALETGATSWTTLLQHTNGNLYGHTILGGTAREGTLYRYDLDVPPFVTFLPVYGRVGAKVVILGQYFENNSVVSFNGMPAQNVEIHSTYIKAIVPDGATTGPITVATSKGGQPILEKSNKIFVVH